MVMVMVVMMMIMMVIVVMGIVRVVVMVMPTVVVMIVIAVMVMLMALVTPAMLTPTVMLTVLLVVVMLTVTVINDPLFLALLPRSPPLSLLAPPGFLKSSFSLCHLIADACLDYPSGSLCPSAATVPSGQSLSLAIAHTNLSVSCLPTKEEVLRARASPAQYPRY